MRVDKDDNIWAVDKGSDMVIKFNPEGRVVMVFGRKKEASDEAEAWTRVRCCTRPTRSPVACTSYRSTARFLGSSAAPASSPNSSDGFTKLRALRRMSSMPYVSPSFLASRSQTSSAAIWLAPTSVEWRPIDWTTTALAKGVSQPGALV